MGCYSFTDLYVEVVNLEPHMEGVSLPVLVDIDVNEQGPGLEGVPVGGHHLEPGLPR